MKKRTPLLLIAFLGLALLLLFLLGFRVLKQESMVAEHQLQQLALAKIRSVESTIQSYVRSLERESANALSFLNLEDGLSQQELEQLRFLAESDPFLDHAFVLDAERQPLFPPSTEILRSNKETLFWQELAPLAAEPDAFYTPKDASESETTVQLSQSKSSPIIKRSSADFVSRQTYQAEPEALADVVETDAISGLSAPMWTTWDLGTSTNYYLWQKDQVDRVLGQKISAAYLLAQLINRLPTTSSLAPVNSGTLRLVSKKQNTFYQWGNLPIDISQQPIAQQWLSTPFTGWRLEYYEANAGKVAPQTWLFGLSAIALCLLSILGGVLFWRDYRRDIADAQQRVTFVNQVSHELKTPLTNICMYTEMLESEVAAANIPNQQRVNKFSSVITSESQRLSRLINNVLNFAKMGEQGIRINLSAANLDSVVTTTAQHFEAAFKRKSISLELNLDHPQTVMVDTEVLQQVLQNLFSNAEKYAPESTVSVSTAFKDNISTIEVADTGPGISKALERDLFEPFVRGSNKLTEGVSGTGIGLSIAQELCHLHGGELSICQHHKPGACFRITLATPLAAGEQ